MTGPRVLPDHYGPTGGDIASAFAERERQKRLKGYDARAQAESDERLAESRYRLQHDQATDPLEDALRRAAAREHGIIGPNEQQGPASGQGLPPASVPRPGPRGPTDEEGGAGPGGGSAPAMRPQSFGGFGAGASPAYDTRGLEGTAHALPGAFNPVTGTHNPADIDLGGGYKLQGSMTQEGRRARDSQELANAHVPGVTPELAMYLADHPEHMAPFFERAYGRGNTGWHAGSEAEQLDYDEKLARIRARYPAHESEKPDITLAGALEQVDRMYGRENPVTGEVQSRLNPQARLRLAREMTRGEYSHLGPSANYGSGSSGAPTYEDAMARRGIKTAPLSDDERQQDASGQRATQIKQIRSMIPKGASPGRVRAILKKHGLTPQEIDQVVGQQ